METIKLKNGAEEALSAVVSITANLEGLLKDSPVAFYDLVSRCNNPGYSIFPPSEKILDESGLLVNGTIHNTIKNIIHSGVTGEGMDIQWSSPVA